MNTHPAGRLDPHAVADDPQADDALLDRLQRSAFDYFLRATNPQTGLVADTTREGAPSSIAVVGFALSAYPVGVERGWMERTDAVQRALASLRFFMASDQSGSATASGYRGFYYHFLDMRLGTRVWGCELSPIDTTLLIAGILTAAAYFDADTPDETELRCLADALYQRVDWLWMQHDSDTVMQGWKPECGFLHYGWEGYSEALLLYALGLGSPTHALTRQSFPAWTATYQWEAFVRLRFSLRRAAVHPSVLACLDRFSRHPRHLHAREGLRLFREQPARDLCAARIRDTQPRGFIGYGHDRWGLSAGEGPSVDARLIAGRRQAFHGYAARGVPFGPDDGTIAARL